MEDVVAGRTEFGVGNLNQEAYIEKEVFDLIQEIKESQRMLSGPDTGEARPFAF